MMETGAETRRKGFSLLRLLVSEDVAAGLSAADDRRLRALRWSVYIGLHLLCLAALWTGVSTTAIVSAFVLYVVRMFFVTAFYHRYFSHKAFKASRVFQFLMAVAGCTAGQRGPLWWAGHHRQHHAHADDPDDPHSPKHKGMLAAHMGWFLETENCATRWKYLRDLERFPELVWINRYDFLPFLALGALVYGVGAWLAVVAPELGTDGPQMLVVGFLWSTIALYHGTYTINSLAHRFGKRRFATKDDSRNNAWLALITLGEGWHNNHHFYPGSARQGFRWWEFDPTYAGLWMLARLGLVTELRPVPAWVIGAWANRQ
ncbi:MAG TPA: acyl-CoA desaturase [Gammaproteobacteria bacterium]